MMLTGALIGPILAPEGENPALRLFWLPSFAVTLGLALLRLKVILRAWPAIILVGALVLLATASLYWSIDPETTKRRVLSLAINSVFGLYLATRFAGTALPRLIALSSLWMGVLSVIFVIALPHIGIHQDANAGLWRGIWYEKNQMAWVMVAGAIAAASWQSSQPRLNITAIACLLLSILLVLATASKTSLLCLILGLGLVAALTLLRRAPPAMTVAAIWIGAVGMICAWWIWTTQSEALLAALGKDPTLTGRTAIWNDVWAAAMQRPWLGHGYNAFWGVDSVPANWIRYQTQWAVPSAHNGWLDVLIQLGFIGTVLVAMLMITAYLSNLIRLGSYGTREGFWSIAQLNVIILLSLSESILLTAQALPWILCIAALARGFSPTPPAGDASIDITPRPVLPVPNPQSKPRLHRLV